MQKLKNSRENIMTNGYIKIITAMTLWGTIGLFVLWSNFDSMTISFFRCLIAIPVLFCLMKDLSLKEVKQYTFKDYFWMMVGGACLVLNWVFLFKSFQLASITLGNVSYYTQPIFLVLLGILFLQENVPARKWFFIFLTFVGIIFTVNIHFQDLHFNNHILLGTLYALLAGVLYAMATIIVKKQQHINSQYLTFIQLITGLIILLPFLNLHLLSIHFTQWKYIVIIGIIHTAIPYLLYYNAVRTISVTAIAVLSYLDPIVAIITDIIYFNRHLTTLQWAGIGLTLMGSYVVLTLKNTSNKESII